MPEMMGPFPPTQLPENVDPQTALLQALMASYPELMQQSADADAEAMMQQKRMDRTRWGGKGLSGLVAGLIGNKVADKRRPEYQQSLADAMMAKSRAGDAQDQMKRYRDVAQDRITTNYEYGLKGDLERDKYYRTRTGEVGDRTNEREYQSGLLADSNKRQDMLLLNRNKREDELTRQKPTLDAAVVASKLDKTNTRTFDVYSAGMNGLKSALGKTDTGPVVGMMPAVTAAQQIADGAIAAMAPVMKQMFRAAGEGIFTDRDQALLMEMMPDRTDHPEARKEKLANIDRIVRAKLGMEEAQDAAPESKTINGKIYIKVDGNWYEE